ncbi:unnamed protein product [Clonostachys rosea]|uniref:Cyanovirin-N domain-containing protein n=1 Tax=Bionectria ochroleuca TaxID=29856 RepID=A0ABY6TZ90_BIOOC|nr:unnamed protein product [Clonostachys rosea]
MSLTKATQTTGASPASALTTPFVPPTGCADKFPLTIGITDSGLSNGTKTSSVLTILASGPDASGYADCQPSQWNTADSSLSFSPAVCPSAWTAYRISQNSNGTWEAHCCSRGFIYGYHGHDIHRIENTACVRAIANNMTTSTRISARTNTVGTVVHKYTDTIKTSSGSSTLLIHNAWHIYWDPTDVASLSPTPPIPVCSTSTINTWTPGESLINGTYLGSGCERPASDMGSAASWRIYAFLIVGLPIILGLALIGGVAFAIYSCTKKRRVIMFVPMTNLAATQTLQAPESQLKASQIT